MCTEAMRPVLCDLRSAISASSVHFRPLVCSRPSGPASLAPCSSLRDLEIQGSTDREMYKNVERPPTPPDTPAILYESHHEEEEDVYPVNMAGSSISPFELAMANPPATSSTFRPPSPPQASSSRGTVADVPMYTASPDSPSYSALQSTSTSAAASTSAYPPEPVASSSLRRDRRPSPTTASAYPAPNGLAEQLQQGSRSVAQHARLAIGAVNQTIASALPNATTASSTTSGLNGHASTQPTRRRSSSPTAFAGPANGALQHSLEQSSRDGGRRLLTTRAADKQKGRADTSWSAPAWQEMLDALAGVVASVTGSAGLSGGGGKRIRTRTRRLLILLGLVVLLCYVFSNTLQEAYYSAAVEREQHHLEDLEMERLGLHLTEYEVHPIKRLMDDAKREWEAKVERQSKTVEAGMAEYRRRYKREPPHGYAEWFEYAQGECLGYQGETSVDILTAPRFL